MSGDGPASADGSQLLRWAEMALVLVCGAFVAAMILVPLYFMFVLSFGFPDSQWSAAVDARRLPRSGEVRLRASVYDDFGDLRLAEELRFEVAPSTPDGAWSIHPGVLVPDDPVFSGHECVLAGASGSTIELRVAFRRNSSPNWTELPFTATVHDW